MLCMHVGEGLVWQARSTYLKVRQVVRAGCLLVVILKHVKAREGCKALTRDTNWIRFVSILKGQAQQMDNITCLYRSSGGHGPSCLATRS